MTSVEQHEIEVSPDQTKAWVHFKEIGYGSFASCDKLHPFSICKIMESGRALAMGKSFMDLDACINQDYGMFILASHYTYHPTLWTVRRCSTFPHEVSVQALDLGRTSSTMESRLINKLDQQLLATVYFKYVHVHRETRRAVPFPDWFMAKYKSSLTVNHPHVFSKDVPKVPPSAYKYEVTVADSDTDRNGHTNQATYVRFLIDATEAAVKDRKLSRLEPSLWDFPLLELQAVYVKESFLGDRIQVLLWQQEDHPDTIRYVLQVQRDGQQQVIFHAYSLFGQDSAMSSHL